MFSKLNDPLINQHQISIHFYSTHVKPTNWNKKEKSDPFKPRLPCLDFDQFRFRAKTNEPSFDRSFAPFACKYTNAPGQLQSKQSPSFQNSKTSRGKIDREEARLPISRAANLRITPLSSSRTTSRNRVNWWRREGQIHGQKTGERGRFERHCPTLDYVS